MEKTNAVIDFLLGEGDLEGRWFGDGIPEGKGPFWWRTHLRNYTKEGGWINAEDQLPDISKGRFGSFYALVTDGEKVTYAWFTEDTVRGKKVKRWRSFLGKIGITVTHWMPLPKPPKK